MPPEMMVGEVTGAAGIGLLVAIVIRWLRDWAKNSPKITGDLTKVTHFLSHLGCLLTTVGIHWMFEGDFLMAGDGVNITIHVPDAYHLANALILYGSNLGTQKTMAALWKAGDNLSAIGKVLPQLLAIAQQAQAKPQDKAEAAKP